MSGFEIAGVVLGGFPLLITCLEHYREGLEPLEEWWNFRTHFVAFIDDIRHQMMLYHENLLRLLDPIIADTESLTSLLLIQERKDPRWDDGSLEGPLRERLASEYDRFFRILERMNEIMAKLEKLLQIQDGKVSWLDSPEKKPWQWHLKRLRISFSKGKHKRVHKLAACNRELQEILGYNERVIPIADRRKSSEPVRFFDKICQHACSVYNALKQHWRCDRSCKSHEAHLNLHAKASVSISLNMVFILGSGGKDPGPSGLTLHQVEVMQTEVTPAVSINIGHVQKSAAFTRAQTAMEKNVEATKQNLMTSLPLEPQIKRSFLKSSLGKLSSRFSSRPRKNVTFDLSTAPTIVVPADRSSSESKTAFKASTKETISGDPSWSNQTIIDLCVFLAEDQAKSGVISDDDSDRHFRLCKLSSDLHPSPPGRLQLVRLPELMNAQHQASIDISRYCRFQMAIHIASALLQTHTSPWLSQTWSKHDFLFLFDTTSQSLHSAYPFVSRSFHPLSTRGPTTDSHTVTKSSNNPGMDKTSADLAIPIHHKPPPEEETARLCLFTVGVILLELIFGHNIEDCSFRKQYLGNDNKPTDGTDKLTADKWAQRVPGEAGPEVADAVRRCLHCSFGPKPNLRDVAFRESVYKFVVEPLQAYSKVWPEVMA